jgi:hypothetical protein
MNLQHPIRRSPFGISFLGPSRNILNIYSNPRDLPIKEVSIPRRDTHESPCVTCTIGFTPSMDAIRGGAFRVTDMSIITFAPAPAAMWFTSTLRWAKRWS